MNSMEKKKMIISFSGGRTSAYMLWWLVNEWKDRHNWEMIIIFANTGKEHEGTLKFVDKCANEWNLPITWVEGYPNSTKGWSVIHKVVNYQTASRKGEPFEAMIAKLGIPSESAPFCSKQLKKAAIESYAKALGWKDYKVAIGIRNDEVDRVNENWRSNNIIYPLIQFNPVSKRDVTLWWMQNDFDLNIPKGFGNCDNCWKKGIKDLINNARLLPQTFKWWQDMTDKYGYLKPREGQKDMIPPFNFYRGNKSPKDILEMTKLSMQQIELFSVEERLTGCSESCEAF